MAVLTTKPALKSTHIRSFNPMTLTRRTSLLLLFLCSLACSAQKRNNVWAFGDSLGLDFNTDPVSAIKTRSSIVEAPYFLSSICDTSGMLWFYSDGLRIWNTNNVRLPKHGNFWPWDGHVMPLFVPYPNNDSLF